jgi:hypothetical protein
MKNAKNQGFRANPQSNSLTEGVRKYSISDYPVMRSSRKSALPPVALELGVETAKAKPPKPAPDRVFLHFRKLREEASPLSWILADTCFAQ